MTVMIGKLYCSDDCPVKTFLFANPGVYVVATDVWRGKISKSGGISGQSYCTAPVAPSPVSPTPVPTVPAFPKVPTVPTIPTVPTAFPILA
jgi:hypothetical protein